jgi:nanoRNase/pAp phosphatase (c-di-AMP/oligoRNAs hydrolase)
MDAKKKFRLVMRSDFDGMICAVLLRKLDLIDDILFVHPKDMQDGKIEITDSDITVNLPYVEGVHLAFDHHLSEIIRLGTQPANSIIDPGAPSTARVIYSHYGGPKTFPDVPLAMMEIVNKVDSGQFSEDEILHPKGWVLLHFLMDARTGLGRFHDFRISNYHLMMDLIGYYEKYSIDEILQLPDVKERVDIYFEYEDKFKVQIKNCSKVFDRMVVLDLRDEEVIYPGNRFMIYTLFPECHISAHVMWGRKKQNVVFAVGKSIFNRTSKTNIGRLMLLYGGGGHMNAGTCQIGSDQADKVLRELIRKITAEEIR